MKLKHLSFLVLVLALVLTTRSALADPLGTAFTYQGQLKNGGAAYTGTCDMQFSLYDALAAGTQIGTTQNLNGVTVTSSLFTVKLDFGASVFTGDERYLEIAVKCGADAGFTTLSPRQQLTAVPYALYALNAPSSGAGWSLTGNSGTDSSTNFVGTTDDEGLTLRVNNVIGWRLQPNGTNVPSIIGGYSGNSISGGVIGGVIGGGGASGNTNLVSDDYGVVGGGFNNQAGDNGGDTTDNLYTTIGGGFGNTASRTAAVVAGGQNNLANSDHSAIVGGEDNTASNSYASILGGGGNTASGLGSVIGGGFDNTASGRNSAVGGGNTNQATRDFSTVGGGQNNTASGDHSIVGGGESNTASGFRSTIAGGYDNSANTDLTTVAGGESNTASGDHATIGGGIGNTASGGNSVVGGGNGNQATGNNSTIAGGSENLAGGDSATIGGGNTNETSADQATIAGGEFNIASSSKATVGGGSGNTASQVFATVSGGESNVASNDHATVAGGVGNTASGSNSAVSGGDTNEASGSNSIIIGGFSNIASGDTSVVLGGDNNSAAGDGSTVGGHRAKGYDEDTQTPYNGVFLYADGNDFDFFATGDNQFRARATGGVQFVTAIDGGTGADTAGVKVDAGDGSWSSLSDRNAKQNFSAIDAREILRRVAAMPILKWNYKSQSDNIQHIGPMAQDFYAAFNVGSDEKHITTIDADGVSLAAIQGLNQVVQEQQVEINALKNQNADYARATNELKLFSIGAIFAALLAVGACVYVVRTQVAMANRKT